MALFIKIYKLHLKIIYFFLKLIPTNNKKILLLSRQTDDEPINYELIRTYINNNYPDYNVVELTKRMKSGLKGKARYNFHVYKQMYHLATSKICIADTYIIPVSVLKHKNDLTIIQLCHGVGNIKKFGYQTLKKESGKDETVSKLMNMHANYDYVVSTSKLTSKFYSEAFNIGTDKMLEFGPPKIDYILNVSSKKDEVLSKYPHIKDKPVILYVSTFRTYEDDYLKDFCKYADTDNYNVIINIHPVAYSLHPDIDKCIDDRFYRCSDIGTTDLLSIADFAITDYSSFLFESAILDIPTYLYIPDYNKYKTKNGLNVDIKKELSKYVYDDPKKIFKDISKNNYDDKDLIKFKNKYIENTKGDSTKQLVEFMIGASNEKIR